MAEAVSTRPVRTGAITALLVVACAVAAAATSVMMVGNASRTSLFVPLGVLGLAGLVALAVYRFEWFVLAVLATRTLLDAAQAPLKGTTLAPSGISKTTTGVSSGALTAVLGVLFIVLSAAWLLAQHRRGAGLNGYDAVFGFLVVSCFLSIPGGVDKLAAANQSLRIVAAVLMFAVLSRMLTSLQQVRRTVVAGAIAALPPLVIGFIQAAKHQGFQSANFTRISGTFLHPNTFGFFLVMVLLMSAALFASASTRVRIIMVMLDLVCLVALALSYSRGAWLAGACGLIVLGIVHSRRIFLWMVLGAAATVAVVPSIIARIANLGNTSGPLGGPGNSLVWRFSYWHDVIGLANRDPIFGIGLDGTRTLTSNDKSPHNDFLRAYVELGVVGLLALIAVVVMLVVLSRRSLRATRGLGPARFERGVAAGFAAILVAYIVDSLGDNLMTEVVVLWYLYAAAACAFAVTRITLSARKSDQIGAETSTV